jgi:phospholipase C
MISKLFSFAIPVFLIAVIFTPNFASHTVTATPIQHVVVLFQENESFDHYFGTYPNATNPAGEPRFAAAPDTPTVNGLTSELLNHNPNRPSLLIFSILRIQRLARVSDPNH